MMGARPDQFTLAVESGLHEGVVEKLAEGRYRIGSDIGCDIVLLEDAIAPSHFVVGLAGAMARIEALAPGVTVDGSGTLEAGSVLEVPLPAGLTVGSIRLTLSGTRVPADGPSAMLAAHAATLPARAVIRALLGLEVAGALARTRVPADAPPALPARTMVRALLALQVAAVLVLLVVPNPVADAWGRGESGVARSVAAGDPRGVAGPIATGSTAGAEELPERLAQPLPEAAQPVAAEAADALRVEVERLGLLDVSVEAGTGIVAASGTIEPAATARWQSAQQWFDERFAGEITLVNDVTVKAETMPVALGIEAVWRGEPAHLIIRGQKYLEGAVLDGGWTIRRIEPERVVLERDGRLVAVRY